jgi:hypothetical protein
MEFDQKIWNNIVDYLLKNKNKKLSNIDRSKMYLVLKSIKDNLFNELSLVNKTKFLIILSRIDNYDKLSEEEQLKYNQIKNINKLISGMYKKYTNIDLLLNKDIKDIENELLNKYFFLISYYNIKYKTNNKIKFGYML